MRHQKNRLTMLPASSKSNGVYVRMYLTNLLDHGKLTTTEKRAKILKAHVDHFFSKLLEISARYPQANDAKRECISYVKSLVFGDIGKKVIDEMLPKYQKEGVKSGFVNLYRLGHRVGDGAAKVLVKLI